MAATSDQQDKLGTAQKISPAVKTGPEIIKGAERTDQLEKLNPDQPKTERVGGDKGSGTSAGSNQQAVQNSSNKGQGPSGEDL